MVEDLERSIAPDSRGDPISPLRWTCKSTRHLAEALEQQGFTASHRLVGEMLHHLGYSLQANAKNLEGKQHPDRDAQFRYINDVSGPSPRGGRSSRSIPRRRNWSGSTPTAAGSGYLRASRSRS